MRKPLFVIGFTYLLSLMIANMFGLAVSVVLGITFLILSVTIILLKDINCRQTFLCVFLAAMIAFASYSIYIFISVEPVRKLDNQDANITATLVETPTKSNGRYYYLFETDSILLDNVPQNIKVRVSTTNPLDIEPYERIKGKVHFYLASDEDSSFTSRNYYDSKGIYIQGFLYEYESYSILPREVTPPYYYALQIRQSLMQSINYVLPQKEASLVNAVLLGQKQDLNNEVINDFRTDGISHVLAVSGLHISLLAAAFMMLLIYLKVPRKISALSSIGLVLLFMAVTGFVPSVMRAGIMAIIMYLGIAFSKRADTMNSLGASALILCLINPLAAGDLGLILSFFATLGLITLSPKLYAYTNSKINVPTRLDKPIRKVNGVFCATISAVLFTLPFTVISFGTISLIAPLANLLLVFPMSIMMILGLFAGILNMLNLVFLAMPIAFLAKLFADYSLIVSSLLAKIPYASISAKESFVLIAIAGIIILVAVAIYLKGDRRTYKFCTLLSILIIIFGIASYQFISGNSTVDVTVIDTGEGCAVSVNEGYDDMLISSGGEKSGAYAIDTFLQSNRVDRLEFMLVPDSGDNASGAAGEIMEKYNPQVLLINEDCKNEEHIARELSTQSPEYFYKNTIASVTDDIAFEVKTSDEKSFIACDIAGKSFLICPNGGDVSDIPEEWRNCNFFVVGDMPKNPELINCDYLIMSMYEDDMMESLQSGLPCCNTILSTSKDGNIEISITKSGKITVSKK